MPVSFLFACPSCTAPRCDGTTKGNFVPPYILGVVCKRVIWQRTRGWGNAYYYYFFFFGKLTREAWCVPCLAPKSMWRLEWWAITGITCEFVTRIAAPRDNADWSERDRAEACSGTFLIRNKCIRRVTTLYFFFFCISKDLIFILRVVPTVITVHVRMISFDGQEDIKSFPRTQICFAIPKSDVLEQGNHVYIKHLILLYGPLWTVSNLRLTGLLLLFESSLDLIDAYEKNAHDS